MKKMKKSTLAAFGIAVGLAVLAVGLLIGIWAGCSPLLLVEAPESEAGGTAAGTLSATEGELSPAGDGEMLLVLYPFGKDAPARSVAGAGSDDIQSTGRGVRNYAQVIVMEDSLTGDGTISTFDQTTDSRSLMSVKLKEGKTYHFLILQGHKNDVTNQTEKPTLLAGGYAKKAIVTGANTVKLPLVPVLVDAVITDDAGNGVPGGAIAYDPRTGAALSLNAAYLAQVKLGAVQAQAGTTASGDGLWPLKLAEPAVRRDGITWEGNSVVDAQGSYATKISDGGYTGGNAVLDAAGITVTQNTGHYVFGSSDAPLADSLAAGGKTAGSLKYAFTTGGEAGGGRFYFNLEYVPFAVTAVRWSQTGMPVWVIRNGFDDAAQDGDTSFAGDFTGNPVVNGHGAIGIIVAGGAAVTGVTVNPDTLALSVGNMWQLTAEVAPVDTANQGVTWGTSASNIASVSTNGLVTARGAGTAVITARSADRSKTGTCAVTVTPATQPPVVTSVMVSPSTASVQKGAFQYFSATVQGTNNPAQTVIWAIDEAVVSGTGITNGLLTVAALETATSLTVRATSAAAPGISDTAAVTVTDLPPAAATLSGGTVTISATKANSQHVGGVAASATLIINLINATVRTAINNTSAAGWVQTVAGLTFTATATAGASIISIAVGGTPTETSAATGASITLPAGTLNDTNGSAIASALPVIGTINYNIGAEPESAVLPPLETDLTACIGRPKTGEEPIPPLTAGSSATGSFDTGQYTGTVTWSHNNAAHTGVIFDELNDGFWGSTVYMATAVLTAKSGYTFTGVSFSHSGATKVTPTANTGDTITVTILFPNTDVGSGSAGGDPY
jgi:hypothetical protein